MPLWSDRRICGVDNRREDQVFGGPGRELELRGNRLPQRAIGGDTEAGVVVEAPPPSAFVVAQSQFLLELLIVSLDPPTQLGGVDELGDCSVGRQGGEPILARLDLAFRPLDQEPLFGVSLAPIVVPGCRPQAHGGEAGIELGAGSSTPGDRAPSLGDERGHSGPLTNDIVLNWVQGQAKRASPFSWARRLEALSPVREVSCPAPSRHRVPTNGDLWSFTSPLVIILTKLCPRSDSQ